MGLLGVQHDWIGTHTDTPQPVSVIIPSENRTTIVTVSTPKKAPLRHLLLYDAFKCSGRVRLLTMLTFCKFINFIKVMPFCILIYLNRNYRIIKKCSSYPRYVSGTKSPLITLIHILSYFLNLYTCIYQHIYIYSDSTWISQSVISNLAL